MRRSKDLRIRVGDREVSGLLLDAVDPLAMCLITHGAGTSVRHPFYAGIAEAMADEHVASLRFNFPYTEQGRRSPDRPPLLQETWRAALAEGARCSKGLPLIASGKSLGGRMASLVAAKDGDTFAARALVFFGYPLHAPGRTDQLRDEHLPRITVPMLFIEGTSDALARFDLMEALVARLGPRAHLASIEGGDHSFRVRGAKRSDEEIGRELGMIAAKFIGEVMG